MRKRILLTFSLLIILTLIGTSIVTTAGEKKSLLEKVKDRGYIIVGIANEAPFGYIDEEGNVTGESPEIARAVLKRLGIGKMEAVVTEFGSLIPGLKAGRFDMITAGAYITADREKEVDFAHPQYKIGSGAAVRAGNPYNIHSYYDIAANPHVKVAIMGGAYEYKYARVAGVTDKQIVTVPTNIAGIAALIAGRADVLVATSVSIADKVKKAASPEIEIVKDFKDLLIKGVRVAGYSSVAFPEYADEFRKAYNRELEKLRAEGTVCEILKSFGFPEACCVKETLTVEQVLEQRKALEEAVEEAIGG